MDLGIRGRTAIACAAWRGLGRAMAVALAREGVNLIINARSEAALATLADDFRRETGVSVTAVAAGIASEEGRRVVLAAAPNPDILINNAGGPPPAGRFP